MPNLEIVEGGIYAGGSQAFAREVLRIDGKDVHYADYQLFDGQPQNSKRRCKLSTFRQFAVRVCSPEEVARLRRDEPFTEDTVREEMITIVAAMLKKCVLKGVSDADLLDEVKRRKLAAK